MDERPVRRGGPREFEDLMTRGERLAAGVYLPCTPCSCRSC